MLEARDSAELRVWSADQQLRDEFRAAYQDGDVALARLNELQENYGTDVATQALRVRPEALGELNYEGESSPHWHARRAALRLEDRDDAQRAVPSPDDVQDATQRIAAAEKQLGELPDRRDVEQSIRKDWQGLDPAERATLGHELGAEIGRGGQGR